MKWTKVFALGELAPHPLYILIVPLAWLGWSFAMYLLMAFAMYLLIGEKGT